VIRSSASIGANYLEANDPLSQKDFLFRIRICRREAKETAYFLRLLAAANAGHTASEAERLMREAIELKRIFSSIFF
jgi:four helix bundle protein